MQPKSYTVFKWAVYALATLLFFSLQGLVLDHVRVWGLTPFLYPILPAVEAMYEGPRRGPVFPQIRMSQKRPMTRAKTGDRKSVV